MKLIILLVAVLTTTYSYSFSAISINGQEVSAIRHGQLKFIKNCVQSNSDRIIEYLDIDESERFIKYEISGSNTGKMDLLKACSDSLGSVEDLGEKYIILQ